MAWDFTKFPFTIEEFWDEYNYNVSKRTTTYIQDTDWGLFYQIAQDKLRTLIDIQSFNIWDVDVWNTLNINSKGLIFRALARLLIYYFNATDINVRQGISISQGQISVSKSVPSTVEPMVQQEVINFLIQAGIYNNAITLNLRDDRISSMASQGTGAGLLFSGAILPSQKVLTLTQGDARYLQAGVGITSTDQSVAVTTGITPSGYPYFNLEVRGSIPKYDHKTLLSGADGLYVEGLESNDGRVVKGGDVIQDITNNNNSITSLSDNVNDNYVVSTNIQQGSNVTIGRSTVGGKPVITINATGGGHTTPPDDTTIKVNNSKLSTVAVYNSSFGKTISGDTLISDDADLTTIKEVVVQGGNFTGSSALTVSPNLSQKSYTSNSVSFDLSSITKTTLSQVDTNKSAIQTINNTLPNFVKNQNFKIGNTPTTPGKFNWTYSGSADTLTLQVPNFTTTGKWTADPVTTVGDGITINSSGQTHKLVVNYDADKGLTLTQATDKLAVNVDGDYSKKTGTIGFNSTGQLTLINPHPVASTYKFGGKTVSEIDFQQYTPTGGYFFSAPPVSGNIYNLAFNLSTLAKAFSLNGSAQSQAPLFTQYNSTFDQIEAYVKTDSTTIYVTNNVLTTKTPGLIKTDYLRIVDNKITLTQAVIDALNGELTPDQFFTDGIIKKTVNKSSTPNTIRFDLNYDTAWFKKANNKLSLSDALSTKINTLESTVNSNLSLWQIKDLGSSGQEVQLKKPRQLFMHNKIIYGVGDATNSSEAVNLGVLTQKITPIQTKANKNETDVATNKTTLATLSTSVSDLQTKQVQDRTKINNIESVAVGKDQFTGEADELMATHTLSGTNAVKYSFAPTFRTKIASFVPRDNFITGFGTKVTHDSSRNEVKYEINHSPLDFGFDAQKRLILAPFFKEKVNDLPQRTRTDRLTKDFSGIGAMFIFEFDPTWEDYLTLEPSLIDVDFAITPKGADRDTFHLRTRIHTGDFDVSGGLGFPTGSTGNNSYTFNLVNNANYSGLSPEVYGNTAITFQAPSGGVSKWRMFYRGPALSTGRNPYNPDDTTVYAYKKITITLTRYADYWGVFI